MRSELTLQLQKQRPRMYRVALRIVGSHDGASEVVQTASLKSWRRIDTFRGQASLASWLYRITYNAALDYLRQSRTAPIPIGDISRDLFEQDGKVGHDRQVENRELCEIALSYVNDLPEDCRQSFVLSQLDGYSYQQIAEIESIPAGTVASRIHRAKRILRDQLRDHIE